MASPYVAGIVARYLAQNPGKTPAELKAWVVSQAEDDLITAIPPAACAGIPNKLAQADCYI